MTTMPALPAQGTTNWYGWVQAAHTNLVNVAAMTSDGANVTLTGLVQSANLTATGSVTSVGPLVLGQISSTPTGTVNNTTLYALTDGTIHVRAGTGTTSRLPQHWGSGTTLPALGAGTSINDSYYHTGLGCIMRWDGTVWRQVGRTEVNSTAARDTIATNYGGSGGLLYYGFTVFDTSTNLTWIYNNSGWTFPQSTPIYIQTAQPTGAPDGSLWFKV